MSKDLENLAIIEKKIGRKLKRKTIYPNARSKTSATYLLDKNNNVAGLQLLACGLSDISFLKLLPNLTQIILSDNHITDISILKFLPNLTHLLLGRNHITDISVLNSLPNLTHLSLRNNRIRDILVLEELTKLRSVVLNKNNIYQLPRGLLSLNLKIIYKDIIQFDRKTINIYDNPIQTPPLEIVKQGNTAIKAYFNSLEKQEKKDSTKVNVFPVLYGDSDKTSEVIERVDQIKDDVEAKYISDEELIKRIRKSDKVAKTKQVTTTVYERNEYVSEFAKRKAKGFCQLCENSAPFNDSKGKPYLESHHVIWLSRGGDDSVENVIALCPNCHAKIHELDIESDVEKLKRKAMENSKV